MSLECALERMGPDVVQLGDGSLDHRAPLIFDAESIAADDLSNLVRRHSTLSRSLQNVSKRSCSDGDKGARATFSKDHIFGGRPFFEFDICAKLGRSVLRPYT